MTETSPIQTEAQGPIAPVDPSPTAPPIYFNTVDVSEELAKYPAPVSPQWVLDLKPNRYEDAVGGPDAQIDPNMYVHMTKPDGSEFLCPLSNVPYYEGKGFTSGAHEEIPDLVKYQADRAKAAPAS